MRIALALFASLALLARTADAEPSRRPPHTDAEVVPLAGGDSDIGVGVGVLGAVAGYDPAYDPYRYRVEVAGFASFKPPVDGGGVRVPYQDYYANLVFPGLIGHKVRLELRPSFDWLSTLGYYGMGNASTDAGAPSRGYFEYGRRNPTMRVALRAPFGARVYLWTAASYTHNWIDVEPGTKLSEDAQNGSPEVRKLLGSFDPHGVVLLEEALVYDSRDVEASPSRGMWHQLKFRASPGAEGNPWLPYRYGSANATARFYLPISGHSVVFASRFVIDMLVGRPPFYELARFEDTFAIGGGNGVRGVPAQRYYGKIKALGNLELRTELATLKLFGKSHTFGVVGFFDAGRVWADYEAHPELDGTGIGLKYGTGLGLRLARGDTLVLRLDAAYSPDARPIGAYFQAGQLF